MGWAAGWVCWGMHSVKDKVVLVTGASSGIGRAAAHLLASQGARVALAARSAQELSALEAQLPGALAVPTDMLDESAVREMVRRTHEHYGRIDALVNNAGRGMPLSLEAAPLSDYRQLLELNVVSVLNAMQQVLPIMRAQGGGNIVNISSGTTLRVLPGMGPYSSSKHALNNLSDIARAEFAPHGIAVSIVYPTLTNTAFGQHSVGITPQRADMYAQGDSPESVALLILQALQTGEAEVFARSLRPQRSGEHRE